MQETVELIALIKAGQSDAFAKLVDKYKNLVASTAYGILRNGHDAEDATQEVFLKTYKALNNYKETNSFANWLLRITANHCLNIVRARKNLRLVSMDNVPELVSATIKDQASGFDAELDNALTMIDPVERAVIVLFHRNEKKYSEIAEILSIPEGTVKTHLHRGRQKLRQLITDKSV